MLPLLNLCNINEMLIPILDSTGLTRTPFKPRGPISCSEEFTLTLKQ